MIKMPRFILLVLGLGLISTWGFSQAPSASSAAKISIFISEIQPGALSTAQYCTLVYTDHHFHSEKAIRHHGQDTERKVYQGELSEAEWNSLTAIIDNKDFRELSPPQTVPPLVMQDTHPFTISVLRDSKYQNMEFLDSKSLKPYQSQIKPLLQWWKTFRSQRTPESNAPADKTCALDSTHAVIGQ
jgi:hypothetical protein